MKEQNVMKEQNAMKSQMKEQGAEKEPYGQPRKQRCKVYLSEGLNKRAKKGGALGVPPATPTQGGILPNLINLLI